jgi:Protein of unknown function (DUF3040)
MSASSASGPGDGALSARERQILAEIEQDLDATDPRLAHRLARPIRRKRTVRWWPISLRCTILLVVVLVVLAGATLFAPSWTVLGLITGVVVVPWLLLCVADRNRHR